MGEGSVIAVPLVQASVGAHENCIGVVTAGKVDGFAVEVLGSPHFDKPGTVEHV